MTNQVTDRVRTSSSLISELTGIYTWCLRCGEPAANRVGECQACGGLVAATGSSPSGLTSASTFYNRFASALPLVGTAGLPEFDLVSPTVRAPWLEGFPGSPEVWLKDESHLPTRSTKDRAAAVAIPYLLQAGCTEIALSSTGNTSTAFAQMAHHFPDLMMHIFVGKDFANRLATRPARNVCIHIVPGNFVAAGAAGQAFARRKKIQWEGGFFNPGRRAGLKTAYIEAAMTVGKPFGVYVQAVSSAMGVIGVLEASNELHKFGITDRTPKLICVQQSSCAPMASAWTAGRDRIASSDIVHDPRGSAKAILRGDPSKSYPHVYQAVRQTNGAILQVTESDIRSEILGTHLASGMAIREEAAAAIAGYRAWLSTQTQPPAGPVLINVTGGDRDALRQ